MEENIGRIKGLDYFGIFKQICQNEKIMYIIGDCQDEKSQIDNLEKECNNFQKKHPKVLFVRRDDKELIEKVINYLT